MKPVLLQVIVGFIVNLSVLSSGLLFGWITPTLPNLLSGKDEVKFTSDQGSWAVSLLSIGCMIGQLFVPLVVDRIGRKLSLLMTVIPMIVGFVILAFANSVELIYLGRVIGGIGAGGPFCIIPMFIGEIAEDSVRGGLGTLLMNMANVGITLPMFIGSWISRLNLSMLCIIPPLLFLVCFPWIPETPYFHLMKGRRKEAEASLCWYRQRPDVKEELGKIQHDVNLQQLEEKKGIMDLIYDRVTRKSLFICTGLLTFQQTSGGTAILAYTSIIFEKAKFEVITVETSLIILSIVKLSSGLVAFFCADCLGRRPTLITSSIITTLALIGIAVFFHLQYLNVDVTGLSWMPLALILVYMLGSVLGLGIIPYVMIGELFPINTKAAATTFLSIYGSLCGAIVGKLFTVVSDAIGDHSIFYAYAVCTFVAILFVYFCVPETKRRPLQEILDSLSNSKGIF